MELDMRLNKNQTIDKHVQDELNKERSHWKDVLLRIFSLVKTLAKQNLAFRGSNEKISADGNGNFLSFIEMLSEWEPVMREHLRRFEDGESRHHYLSNKIQNEVIAMLANEIKDLIIKKIKLDDTSGGLFREIQDVLVALVLRIDNRWKVLEDMVGGLTVKSLSQTRWESHFLISKSSEKQVLREQNLKLFYCLNPWTMKLYSLQRQSVL
ncbi:uncharacterized protein LOC112081568 [Eutrema salsugineum]|uniref:uncharacterized protein LOC112081568 n=1 Tax=Eutrema salsugineum TaxID=72664 RepID=UPI000CECE7C9|nr:uncharacterized protein LOC112081568 [Eutrema salsugineum]